MGARAAQHKLTVIRSVLGKSKFQSIHITEFCTAENINRSLFEAELLASITGKRSQLSLSFA